MEKKVIVSAKTKEEAILLAVQELEAPSADAIEVTVIEEASKGFFGIADVQCISAQGLDIVGNDAQAILKEAQQTAKALL